MSNYFSASGANRPAIVLAVVGLAAAALSAWLAYDSGTVREGVETGLTTPELNDAISRVPALHRVFVIDGSIATVKSFAPIPSKNTPEPGSVSLLALGGIGLALAARRRLRKV